MPEEPSTRPEDWFLEDRGNPDSVLGKTKPQYTSGNTVEVLIDGESYMEKFHTIVNGMEQDDHIHYAGWRMDGEQRLIYGQNGSRVDTTFDIAKGKQVDIKVMLSGHPFFPERNPNEKIRDWFHEHKIECIRDARYPSLGSVHQKFSTMRVKNEWHAFCGGIDLAVNRWDDNNHSMKGERWAEDFYKGGWHDVHSYVRGPACRDLEISFRERWNNPEWPRVLEGPPKKIENLALPSDLPLQDGTHVVQILRTYAPEYDDYDFAKNGELSAGAAWKRAIEKARYHIYIEDQYFVSYEIVNALRKRLDEVDDLTVIVLVPEKVNDLGDDSFHYYQNECIKKLTTAFGDRFAIYHLRNPLAPDKQIYVHAKLMIVDDVWVGIGSMNLNRRSMTHDSEIAIAIVDTDVVDNDEDAGPFPYCRFAHDLRLKLWAEHLRTVAGGPLSEAHSGFQEWRSLAGRENTPAVPHEAYEDRTRKLPWSWVDPNGSEEEIPPD